MYFFILFKLCIYVPYNYIRHSASFIRQYNSRLNFEKSLKKNDFWKNAFFFKSVSQKRLVQSIWCLRQCCNEKVMKRTIWKKNVHCRKKFFLNIFFSKNSKLNILTTGLFYFLQFFICFGELSGLTFAFGLEMEKKLSPSCDFLKKIYFWKSSKKKAKNLFYFFYERTRNLQSKSIFSKFRYDASFSNYSHFEQFFVKKFTILGLLWM